MSDLPGFMVGPRGENADILRELILVALERHSAWRRRFHPDDVLPAADTAPRQESDVNKFVARVRQLLDELLSKEERAFPRSSPRHLGHMSTDLLLPGLVGCIASLLFNQNGIASDPAATENDLEREVIGMLASMAGFSSEPKPTYGGHLCSGGTIGNLFSLWLARGVRTWPLALRIALAHQVVWPASDRLLPLLDSMTVWDLWNLPPDSAIHRLGAVPEIRRAVEPWTLAALGEPRFSRELAGLFPSEKDSIDTTPLVFVGENRHYSFAKALDLLGLGNSAERGALVEIPIRTDFTIDTRVLASRLDHAIETRQRVLAVVATLGTTQTGALDDLPEIAAVCENARRRGLAVGLHVDACYGGYLGTLIRATEGGSPQTGPEVEGWMHALAVDFGMDAATATRLLARDRSEPNGGWLAWHDFSARIAALAQADSVAIDPHKLGYVPYPAGAVLVRDQSQLDAIGYEAPYLWQSQPDKDGRDIGRNTLEGSRPRAVAAACWLAHRAVPLSQEGHGKILAASLLATRQFCEALEEANRKSGSVRIALMNSPHTNIVCYVPYHLECRDLSHAQALCRAVAAQLDGQQDQNFSVASTSLRIHPTFEWLRALGCEEAIDLTVLRSVVMGPAGLNAKSSFEHRGLYEAFVEELLTATEQAFRSLQRSPDASPF